jgi:hypothetical protein
MTRIVEADRIGKIIVDNLDIDWATVVRGEDSYCQKWREAMHFFGFTEAELDVLVDETDFYTGCRDDGWDLVDVLPRFHRIAATANAIRWFLAAPGYDTGEFPDCDAWPTLRACCANADGFARRIPGKDSILIYDGRNMKETGDG